MTQPTSTIKLWVRTDVEDVDYDEFTIEDSETGPEIRHKGSAKLEAGPTATCDVPVNHCPACDKTIAELIGLSEDEVEIISNWRKRKKNGITSERMGEILDKIVGKLDRSDQTCTNDEHRIVLEVERA